MNEDELNRYLNLTIEDDETLFDYWKLQPIEDEGVEYYSNKFENINIFKSAQERKEIFHMDFNPTYVTKELGGFVRYYGNGNSTHITKEIKDFVGRLILIPRPHIGISSNSPILFQDSDSDWEIMILGEVPTVKNPISLINLGEDDYIMIHRATGLDGEIGRAWFRDKDDAINYGIRKRMTNVISARTLVDNVDLIKSNEKKIYLVKVDSDLIMIDDIMKLFSY